MTPEQQFTERLLACPKDPTTGFLRVPTRDAITLLEQDLAAIKAALTETEGK